MSKVRFKTNTSNSFFGHFLYQQILPSNHFLVRLTNEIPWQKLAKPLIAAYKGGAEYGKSPYAPELILKMLLVSYLFNVSEREAENVVNFNLLAKYFVGLGVDEIAPDHATLTVFKDRLLAYQGTDAWENLFNQVINLAQAKGITFGKLQIIDSTHTIAAVNLKKDHQRQKEGQSPLDPDASFKTKGKKTVVIKTGNKAGQSIEVKDQFYGYKSHCSYNQQTQLLTSITTTTGKEDDGKQFQNLVKKDEALGIIYHDTQTKEKAEATAYGADKAYDDGDNHTFLDGRGLVSVIHLKSTRLHKKDPHKQPWLAMVASPRYQQDNIKRKHIEKKFGEGKHWYGWSRCRYLSLTKYAIQAYLTGMVLNLKRLMILTQSNTSTLNLAYANLELPT
jgi:IS5 family transposase